MAWQRTSAYCAHARAIGYEIPPGRPDRVLRDLAASARIPAELRGSYWWYNTADVHEIAAALGLKRPNAVPAQAA